MLSFIRDNKGQSLVEIALVLPVLVFLILGIMEGGRLLAGYLELQTAAREGARNASIGKSDVETEVYMKEHLHILDPNSLDFKIKFEPPVTPPDTRVSGEQVEVLLTHKIVFFTPLIGDLVENPFPLRASIVMRVE